MKGKEAKNASERLVNILYSASSKETSKNVPLVRKYLYEQARDQASSLDKDNEKSILDGLLENQWKQKLLEEAIVDIRGKEKTLKATNVLAFKCYNSFISYEDFYHIYPINRERKYLLPYNLIRGLNFKAIKARNPANLLFTGHYYLVFPCFKHTCAYWLETRGKRINGVELNLQFVDPTANELKYMLSPLLDPNINNVLGNQPVKLKKNVGNTPIQDIYRSSPSKAKLVEDLLHYSRKRVPDYEKLDMDPLYPIMEMLLDTSRRSTLVLVRNLPFGLSKHALPKLLWDYDLAPLDKLSDCITTIMNDPITQVHITLIRFADQDNAKRFVRNFHGRKWQSVQSEKEKVLPEPLLCEILD